jgi:nucleoside-diphosphate-sugar epimerase
MRVFVTGAPGWVGSAVVADLLKSGHEVLGLSRSEEGVRKIEAAGARAQLGSITDLDILKRGAAWADGIVHTAFNHDFSRFVENCAEEQRAIAAFGEAIDGTRKPLIATGGVALLQPGIVTNEDTPPRPKLPDFPRDPETPLAEMRARGLRATLVRLPPSTHGHGDKGFVPMIIDVARQKGFSAYIGDGNNRWPACHRLDAARIYRLGLEHGAEDGPYHAIAEEGVRFRDIATVIGKRLNIPVRSLTPEEAQDHFGFMARFAGADIPSSSPRTRQALGWEPAEPALLADLDHEAYFQGASKF